MDGLENAIKYLKMVYKNNVFDYEFKVNEALPLFLKSKYDFRRIKLFGADFLGVEVKDLNVSFTELSGIEKNLKKYLTINQNILIVLNADNEYIRRECINNGLSFVVPGKEIFSPEIGILYSEYLKKNKYKFNDANEIGKISLAGQSLLFAIDRGPRAVSQKEYASMTGYSQMSISRAVKELTKLNFIKKDHKNQIQINDSLLALVTNQSEYFNNPIQKVVYIKKDFDVEKLEEFYLAGESELSKLSMLAAPKNEVFAIYKNNWGKYEDEVSYIPNGRDRCTVVQLWKHRVPLLKDWIHPLALYLSMIDEVDYRVLGELEDMIEGYKNGKWNRNI